MITKLSDWHSPSPSSEQSDEPVLRAITQLRAGKAIIVQDAEDRENEADLVTLADRVSPDVVNFMITHGRGLVCAPVSREIAERLRLDPMVKGNSDPHRTQFTVSVDAASCRTGISATERARTLRALADLHATAGDFTRPGHVFPLIAHPAGVLGRAGHTEAATDLARLAGAPAAGVICEILGQDGNPITGRSVARFAARFGLLRLTIQQLIRYRAAHDSALLGRDLMPDLTNANPLISYSRYMEKALASCI